ncbi:unnamed protein product [Linum trigynum]|uniref:Uncharacterized protein n=1 Tax=Linum trigynum TaxID=586398 RepID=A0AAV2FVK2_9ROSI
MGRVNRKLRILKGLLKQLNKREYSDLHERVKLKEQEWIGAQAGALQSPSTETFQKEARLSAEVKTLREAEESFLMQKSREVWLKVGDSNSGYFHRSVKIRNKRNMIRSLIYDEGVRLTDTAGMSSNVAEVFYKRLLGQKDSDVELVVLRRCSTS